MSLVPHPPVFTPNPTPPYTPVLPTLIGGATIDDLPVWGNGMVIYHLSPDTIRNLETKMRVMMVRSLRHVTPDASTVDRVESVAIDLLRQMVCELFSRTWKAAYQEHGIPGICAGAPTPWGATNPVAPEASQTPELSVEIQNYIVALAAYYKARYLDDDLLDDEEMVVYNQMSTVVQRQYSADMRLPAHDQVFVHGRHRKTIAPNAVASEICCRMYWLRKFEPHPLCTQIRPFAWASYGIGYVLCHDVISMLYQALYVLHRPVQEVVALPKFTPIRMIATAFHGVSDFVSHMRAKRIACHDRGVVYAGSGGNSGSFADMFVGLVTDRKRLWFLPIYQPKDTLVAATTKCVNATVSTGLKEVSKQSDRALVFANRCGLADVRFTIPKTIGLPARIIHGFARLFHRAKYYVAIAAILFGCYQLYLHLRIRRDLPMRHRVGVFKRFGKSHGKGIPA